MWLILSLLLAVISSINGSTTFWSHWQNWSLCSVTCGFNGSRVRLRNCHRESDNATVNSRFCSNGEARHEVVCNYHYCPIDGSWSEWTSQIVEYGTCKLLLQRRCNAPHPQYGGQSCVGIDRDEQVTECLVPPIPPDHFKDCAILHESRYSNTFPLSKAYTEDCDLWSGVANYYLSVNGFTGHLFTIDLGEVYLVGKFLIKNTENSHHNDRGTGQFTIETAEEVNGPFKEIVSDTLTDVRGFSCAAVLTQTFVLEPPESFRYLKFTAVTKYGAGAGLQFFSMEAP